MKLHIIIASTRPGRVGKTVADWFTNQVPDDLGFEVELVDLAEVATLVGGCPAGRLGAAAFDAAAFDAAAFDAAAFDAAAFVADELGAAALEAELETAAAR